MRATSRPTLCSERQNQNRALRKGWGTLSVVRERKTNAKRWATRPAWQGEDRKLSLQDASNIETHPLLRAQKPKPRSPQRMGHPQCGEGKENQCERWATRPSQR